MAMGMAMSSVTPESLAVAERKNAILTYGVMGAVVAEVLGFLISSFLLTKPTRSIARMLGTGMVGLVVGGILGASSAAIAVPIFHRYDAQATGGNLLASLVLHSVLWASIGLAVGITVSVGMARHPSRLVSSRIILGGLAGTLIGVLVAEGCGAMFLPLAETDRPLAATLPARSLTCVVVVTCLSLGSVTKIPTEDEQIND